MHVQLTVPGLRRLDEVFAEVVAADETLLSGLTTAQRAALESSLRGWLDVVLSGPEADRPVSP